MKPGTKPKPLALKKLEGDIHKERWNQNQPDPEGMPTCPSFLDYEGKREWKRITVILHNLGVIGETDRAILTGYCKLWSDFKRYINMNKEKSPIIKTDKGNIVQNPLENLIHKTAERLLRYEAELGITPSSRNRVVIDKDEKNEDPMESLLSGARNN